MLESLDDDGQAEPFFITERIEAEMQAAGYAFEPPLRIRIDPTGQQAGKRQARSDLPVASCLEPIYGRR